MNLELVRTYLPGATTGRMTVGGTAFFTIEPPLFGPITCVPEGDYILVPYLSPAHGDTWCLSNFNLGIMGTLIEVHAGQHNFVEIHSGNWAEDSRKCILVGLGDAPMLDPHTGRVAPAIEESVKGLGQLLSILGALTTGHTLSIRSGGGLP